MLTEEDKEWTKEQLERVKHKMEIVETSLLTEFHKWTSPFEARSRAHSAGIRALEIEMEALTERVEKLENVE